MEQEKLQSIKDRCKWRGKSIPYNVWRHGQLEIDEYNNAYLHYCIDSRNIPISNKVDIDTIGQYMGRKDENGVEIYEGDVITCNGKYPKIVQYREEKNAFCIANVEELKDSDYMDVWQHPFEGWWEMMNIEIVGNIYDNPELLEKTERGDLIK